MCFPRSHNQATSQDIEASLSQFSHQGCLLPQTLSPHLQVALATVYQANHQQQPSAEIYETLGGPASDQGDPICKQ